MKNFWNTLIGTTCACLFLLLPQGSLAFSDVPGDHFAAEAILDLQDRGILTGYSDGTFKPDRPVNRAEALKIVSVGLLTEDMMDGYTSTSFVDVKATDWYSPIVEWALKGKLIGNAKEFFPSRTITKAEFLKIFLASRSIDPQSFGEIVSPLSDDIRDPKAWYYSWFRYAVATGVAVIPTSDQLGPGRTLTRGDVAVLIHRYYLYSSKLRTQDLLMYTKADLERVLEALQESDVRAADAASTRAILTARGALQSQPNEVTVKVAVKMSEGYRSLVKAFRAGLASDLDGVVAESSKAWKSADEARKLSGESDDIALQLQKYAKQFADQARRNM